MKFLQPQNVLVKILDLLLPLTAQGFKELDRLVGKEEADGTQPNFCKFQFLETRLVTLASFDDRSQQFVLLADTNKHAMCFAQFGEVCQQSSDPLVERFAFEHVLSNEFIESLNVFDCDGLIKDIHGFSEEAGLALQPLKILFVAACGLEAAFFESASDGAAGAEFAEIANDTTFGFAVRVDFFYGVFVVEVEDLADAKDRVGGCVGKAGEKCGVVSIAISQILYLRAASLADGSIVGTANISLLVSFVSGCTGCNVVVSSLRSNEQGQKGVDQRRFARAIFADEQRGLATRLHGVDCTVECPPIVNFQFGQPITGQWRPVCVRWRARDRGCVRTRWRVGVGWRAGHTSSEWLSSVFLPTAATRDSRKRSRSERGNLALMMRLTSQEGGSFSNCRTNLSSSIFRSAAVNERFRRTESV